MKSARSERDLCKTRLSNARVAKGAENGACGSPAKQFQNLPGMTEHCRTRVDCYTDSPPVRKLWGGILPRSDTSAFPRDASGGFTRCCYLSIVSVKGGSAALVFLSITVALCRSRVGARLWNVCRYLSHCVGQGWERGFGVFVDICRIMSDEGESAALVFLSLSVALCRSRWRVRLWNVCRYLSHCVGREGECGFGVLSIFVALCRSRWRVRLWRFVDNCRIVSVEGEALAFLSVIVVLCRTRERVRIRRGCRARQRGCARYKHSF